MHYCHGGTILSMDLEGVNRGNVEKSRQRRSRPVAVLTYCEYAPRVNIAAALLEGIFDHSRRLLIPISSWACMGHVREIFNKPTMELSVEIPKDESREWRV